nr:PTS sugar transporter subunit IIA [Fundicoccus ignavus]
MNDELIFINESFNSSEELFKFVGEKASSLELVNSGFVEAITKREGEYPTGLQLEKFGVAIPHTDAIHIKDEFISIITLREPVAFKPMDGSSDNVKVNLVFVLGLKKPEGQLGSLQTIMQVIQDETKVQNILNANDSDSIIKEL